jgi:hypothetical protein
MLAAHRSSLDMNETFEACLWAACTCAIWGLMRFGEVSVARPTDFNPLRYATRADITRRCDSCGKPYAMIKIRLASAKTAAHW